MKLLIIGHGRHGKDTVAAMLNEEFGLTHLASSEASSTIFVFDVLREKYGYTTVDECFNDRANHRAEWYDLICDYNKNDQARLAKEIVSRANIYVGMRSSIELDECIKQGVFDVIIGVIDLRKPFEDLASMSIDVEKYSNVLILNDGTLEELRTKVIETYDKILEKRETSSEIGV
jgi:dephospho-CoA kinase